MFFKMAIDLPVCKRCCLCLPLRYGLIAWGYVRLVFSSILFYGVTKLFCSYLEKLKTEPVTSTNVYTVILGLLIVLTLADVVLNVVFVIGGHKKNLKLYRAYYMYSFVLWILLSVIGVAMTIYTFTAFHQREVDLFRIYVLMVDVATYMTHILIQAYFLLLIRSEIIKLTNTTEFRFVNNAAESRCSIKNNEKTSDRKKGTDLVCENEKQDTIAVDSDKMLLQETVTMAK